MEIYFTKRAVNNVQSIKSYIYQEWGENVAEAFEEKLNHFLDLLVHFPEIGQIEVMEKNIRGFQLSKQTRIFYRVKKSKIIILTLFDVRQDEQNRPK